MQNLRHLLRQKTVLCLLEVIQLTLLLLSCFNSFDRIQINLYFLCSRNRYNVFVFIEHVQYCLCKHMRHSILRKKNHTRKQSLHQNSPECGAACDEETAFVQLSDAIMFHCVPITNWPTNTHRKEKLLSAEQIKLPRARVSHLFAHRAGRKEHLYVCVLRSAGAQYQQDAIR